MAIPRAPAKHARPRRWRKNGKTSRGKGGDPMALVVHSTHGFARDKSDRKRDSRVERANTDHRRDSKDASGSRRDK
jgi:hypothetical protein